MQQKPCLYLTLSPRQRRKRIQQATQGQSLMNPQGSHQFSQMNPIGLTVYEGKHKKPISLFTYRQPAVPPMKGVCLIFHGLNSHLGHAAHIAKVLSEAGYETVGYDYRGFGRSQGEPGFIESLNQHMDDTEQFLAWVRGHYKNMPLFCLGLSLGGMTCYEMTRRHPDYFKGVILMAPALMHDLSSLTLGVANIISKILPDKMSLFKPRYGQASKNPKITDDVKQDQYAYSDKAKNSTLNILVSYMDSAPSTFHTYECPFMVVQGGLDKLVCPDVAFELYEKSVKVPVKDKKIIFYDDMWHDIWHEKEIWDIMAQATEWMRDMTARNGGK